MLRQFSRFLLSKMSDKSSRRSGRRPDRHSADQVQRGRRLQMERLEAREQMAANLTAIFQDGVLKVEGTPNNDTIYLRNEASKIKIDGINITAITRGISRTWTSVDVSAISSIEVSGLAGNDTIQMFETPGTTPIGMTVYGGKGIDKIYGSSVVDTLMGGDKLDSEQTGKIAAAFDAEFRFFAAPSERLNSLGLNEKWFNGQSATWYYIKPSGEIFRSNAAGNSAGTSIGKVAHGFYSNLSSLLEADSGQLAGSTDIALNLYSTGNLYQNLGGRNEKWIVAGNSNTWHFITPDGILHQQTIAGSVTDIGTEVARLDVSYWSNVQKLVNASTLFGDDDTIYGYGGGDALLGGGGVDNLFGGRGVDFMYGGAGKDSVFGNEDADYIYGDAGNDKLMGGAGNDELYGGDGNDTIQGEADNDIIWGGDERNTKVYANDSDALHGDAGNDEIHGGGGLKDVLVGGENDDTLFGEDGVDYIYGGNGSDSLYGGAGLDYLYGEAGNDGLFGGYMDSVNDWLAGGPGADRFLRPGYQSFKYDSLNDYEPQDAEVVFAYGDKAWTDEEIVLADKGLNWLHKATNNTKLLELPNGVTQFVYRYTTLGADIGGDNNSSGTIRMADLGVVNGIASNIVHEFSHTWQGSAFNAGFMNLSAWRFHNLAAGPIPGGFIQATNNGVLQFLGSGCWIYNYSAQFAREYGRSNPMEDFATSMEMTFKINDGTGTNPASNWQAKYNFVQSWLNSLRT